jgi:hypothetical protein
MKSLIFILSLLFIINSSYAQKFECKSKTSEYKELLIANKIAEAYDLWNEVKKNCQKEDQTIYLDGIKILTYKIDNTTSLEDKEKKVRELLKLYDQYYTNFPKDATDYEINKAMALVNNKIDASDEIFNLLDRGIITAQENVKDANALYTYFSLLCEKYNSGDEKITSNVIIEKYTLVSKVLNRLLISNPENKEYKTAQRAIEVLIGNLATCDNLVAFYTKNFPENKENREWITAALVNLSRKCSNSSLFLTLAEKLYAIKVDSQSANFMGLANLKQRKNNEAIKYYNESAELEVNLVEKAKIYYNLATGLLANDFPKSKESLNKAIIADPKMGKAYIFLAQQYANSANNCGKNELEKKAIYYLGIQTLKKVGVNEPRLKPTADKLIKDFEPNAISTQEITKAKLNGNSITIGCWINETITFPSK